MVCSVYLKKLSPFIFLVLDYTVTFGSCQVVTYIEASKYGAQFKLEENLHFIVNETVHTTLTILKPLRLRARLHY